MTLVEILTVLLLIGILSVFVLPRLFSTADFQSAGFHEELLNALRYAHKTAIASGCEVQLQVDSTARRFDIFFRSGGGDTNCGAGGFTDRVPHPAGTGDYTATASAGTTVSNDLTVTFNSAGEPTFSTSTVDVAGRSITIEAVTGYVR